jgi:uncharacterized protein (TIGR02145 family)
MKTKSRILICSLGILGVTLLFSTACKKEVNEVPTVTTTAISAITQSSATGGGEITSDGGSEITERGICWSSAQNPLITDDKTSDGNGTGSFTSAITGLEPVVTYYVRAYATNSTGTGYGNQVTFTSLGVTDIDGNTYHYITIGTQVWMVENLKTTKFRNGEAIPTVSSGTDWIALTTAAYCDYDDLAANGNTYGHLYNWYAVNDSRNIAPAGWHVPTDAEWQILVNYLGGISIGGGKMKETGTSHWTSPNTGANNSSGFTGLPGGSRLTDGNYYSIGDSGDWWSNSTVGIDAAYRSLYYNNANVNSLSTSKKTGFSVRCIKD